MALMPQNPAKQKNLMAGVVALVLSFGYYQLVHTKQAAEIDALETRLEALETTNAAAKALAARRGPELEDKLAVLEQHMVRLEELIPQREEVPDLLHAMTLRAQAAGVELTRMSPHLEEPGPYYSKQTYEIGVTGTAHRVGRYLTEVGSLPRIVTPTQLTLRSGSGETEPTGSPLLEASFHIVTYILPDAPRSSMSPTDAED